MAKKKSKYTIRADGRIVLTQVIDGKKKYFYGSTDKEAEEKRDSYIDGLRGAGHKAHDLSFFIDLWWDKKEPTLSVNSIGNFKTAKGRVADEFGERAIDEIEPQELYSFLARYAAKGYSVRVVNMLKLVLRQAFDLAFIAGEINRNPINDLPPVKAKAVQAREAATDADIAALEKHKTDSNYTRLLYFCAYTGCRRGEAMGLQWRHIDTERKQATICQSVAYGGQSPTIKQPKTAAGNRLVPLLDNVIEILPERGAADGFVFFPDGLPKMREMERTFTATYKACGMNCTCHQLRHKYASLLHSAGVAAKDAQSLLGHADIKTTMDIYTHIEQQQAATVAAGLNEFVAKRIKGN